VLCTFEPNLADVNDLDDKMLGDPLCWFTIGGPAVILAIAALYFYRKAKRLTKSETKRKVVDRTGYRRRWSRKSWTNWQPAGFRSGVDTASFALCFATLPDIQGRFHIKMKANAGSEDCLPLIRHPFCEKRSHLTVEPRW